MRIGRALVASLGIYIITFILSMIAFVLMGVSTQDLAGDPANIPMMVFVVTLVIAVIISFFGAKWYFKKNGVHAGLKQGLIFGIIFTVVGFVLDSVSLMLIPGAGNVMDYLEEYYADPTLWLGVVAILIATSLAGKCAAMK